ncbi:hypothetical protein T439DRAFT_327930 [Meredithblackwellia eburnea MCA 4105]
MSIGVWEWVVCLPKEFELIWRGDISYVNALYLICLLAFMSNWTFRTCSKLAPLLPGLSLVSTISAELILAIRVVALWGRNRIVTGVTGALLSAEIGVMIAATTKYVALELPPGGSGCFATGTPGGRSLVILYWVLPCVFDAVVFGLTMWKAWQYTRSIGGGTPLLSVVIRDGTLIFFIIFLSNVVNVAFYAQTNTGIQPINSPFTVIITSMMACRLVLNLKSSGTRFLSEHSHHEHANLKHHPTCNRDTLRHGRRGHPDDDMEMQRSAQSRHEAPKVIYVQTDQVICVEGGAGSNMDIRKHSASPTGLDSPI